MKKVLFTAMSILAVAAMMMFVSCSKDDTKKTDDTQEQTEKEFDINDYTVNEAMAGATSWGLIGPAQAGGWDTDTDLEKVSDDPETWKGTIELAADKFKFRGNDEWGNYDLGGGTIEIGKPIVLSKGGGDMALAEAGTYEVILYPQHMVFFLNKK